eukprot:6616858-Pyramimonas_sp.AAC.1
MSLAPRRPLGLRLGDAPALVVAPREDRAAALDPMEGLLQLDQLQDALLVVVAQLGLDAAEGD